ncbi:hypothetical protein BD769DRAFT_1676267 [Suillus cothurnatus]|nr:hypothetical protein BD769DRAFT_1676267 [Suillus cothurnatus]
MEYPSDDIAAARSLQFAMVRLLVDMRANDNQQFMFHQYISVSMATIWVYDYACSLHEEWTFLLRSQWSKMKSLYIVTRYPPSIFLTVNLYSSFSSNDNSSKCRVSGNMDSGLGVALVVFSEFFFILRTYALWNKNRKLLAAILSVSFVSSPFTYHTETSDKCISQTFLTASFIIDFTASVPAEYVTSAIPGITGCYNSSTSFQLFIQFLLLSVFQLGLVMLTLIRAIQNWRININSSSLFVVLVKHNIFYYTCGFLFSVVNIITPLLLQYAYHTMLYDFQVIILAILATRMHRYLWQIANGSGTHAHSNI